MIIVAAAFAAVMLYQESNRRSVNRAAAGPPAPFFSSPVAGDYPVTNLFDHDLPFQFEDENGHTLDHAGTLRVVGSAGADIDGHAGHDWLLPAGTAVQAVAAGDVVFAGESVFTCPILPGAPMVTQLDVQVQHRASNGDFYISRYSHLSAIAVSVGDSIAAGQALGRSGNSGCSTGPHLHFQVFRWLDAREAWVTVDPYGWQAPTPDPWASNAAGATSHLLWKAGQAPSIVPR